MEPKSIVSKSIISKAIEIGAPAGAIYSQCTRPEDLPKLMEGIREIRQIGPARLYWRAEVFGQELEWETEIEEQLPDQRVGWRCTAGASNCGSIELEKLDENRTRVNVTLVLEPQPAPERLEPLLARIQEGLEKFKVLVEQREPLPKLTQVEEGQIGRIKNYPL